MTKPMVFLDMDGVIADFVGSTCKAHGLESPYGNTNCLGIFEMEQCWGMSEEDFWKPLGTFEFWADMPKTPEADEIVDFLLCKFGKENICILTNPSFYDGCISAKKQWVKKNYPMLAGQMLFGSQKQFLAGSGRFLVDDRDKNIQSFNKFGGHGITVPRPWNHRYFYSDTVMQFIKSEFFQLEGR